MTLALLTACGDSVDPRSESLHPGDGYVAIGDSYTAAPLTGPTAAGDACLRTTNNYPHQVARTLHLELTDASCSGAATKNVRLAQRPGGHHPVPPQSAALTGATKLVTISLGGNDFNTYNGFLYRCITAGELDPNGAPCTDALTAAGAEDTIEARTRQIEQNLVDVVRDVKARSPKARVVVVGYPHFFPAAGPCSQLPIATGDFPLAYQVNLLLVRAQRRAATATKVDYIDTFTATKGHDMCSDEPWVAGIRPARPDAAPFHPYPEEQRTVANLVVDLLG